MLFLDNIVTLFYINNFRILPGSRLFRSCAETRKTILPQLFIFKHKMLQFLLIITISVIRGQLLYNFTKYNNCIIYLSFYKNNIGILVVDKQYRVVQPGWGGLL